MSKITIHQASPLPRAHDSLTPQTHLEVVVPVPVEGHRMAEHFRRCGAGHFDQPLTNAEMENLTAAAERVSVELKGDLMQVVVDGKYRAGDFSLNHDYSDQGAVEARAAECATGTVLKLAQGQEPSDMKLSLNN